MVFDVIFYEFFVFHVSQKINPSYSNHKNDNKHYTCVLQIIPHQIEIFMT